MAMFLTKVWGFDAPCGPLQFSEEGWRSSARGMIGAAPGVLVVLVGTKGPPTAPADQGRLLGLMEPTTEMASHLDFALRRQPEDFDEAGRYRWPHGLLNRRAWRLPDRLLWEEVSARRFSMNAALGLVGLTGDEEARILALRREQVELLMPLRARARVEGEEAARRRGAPPPTTVRRGVMHMRRAPAYTYCMELEGAAGAAFKIGWAFDHRARQRGFNLASMPGLGGLRYRTRLTQLWDTAREAWGMEQALLRRFDARRHPGNREVVTGVPLGPIRDAWTDYLVKARCPRAPDPRSAAAG